jgi:hypothetical protein
LEIVFLPTARHVKALAEDTTKLNNGRKTESKTKSLRAPLSSRRMRPRESTATSVGKSSSENVTD